MYDIKDIYEATSVKDAIAKLNSNPDAVIICGGSDVLIKIRERKLAGCSLVSIHGINELKEIYMKNDGTIVIGPAATFSDVTNNRLIKEYMPVLGEATDQAGGPQLRNIGTIGGNVCNGMTSADSASTLLTLNAQLEITGISGKRTMPLQQFYLGPGRVDLKPGELLTAICISKEDYINFHGQYIKYAQRNAMDIATLGCAVNVKLSSDKKTLDAFRIAFGVAAPTPIRGTKTEQAVNGAAIDGKLLDIISETALTDVNPRTSWRASKEFRLQLIRELSKRAAAQAIVNAGGRDLNENCQYDS